MKLSSFIFVLMTLTLIIFLTAPLNAEEKYYQIFVPNPTENTIITMQELGLPMDDAVYTKGVGLELPVNESELALLESRGIYSQILIDDLEEYYAEICRHNVANIPNYTLDHPVHFKYGSQGGFYSYDEMVTDLDSMRLLYPDLVSEKVSLGQGWDGNDIWMVKISDNPDIDEDEPEGIFDGMHHAREPGAMGVIMYAMWYLLENYGTDPEVTYLVDNREMYCVPIVNPDGYLYNESTNPSGGGMWRKNRRNSGGGVYGVDLNRNYSYQWGYDNYGSSPSPGSTTYRGPSPASEPETQAMVNFIDAHPDIHAGMTIHTNTGVYITAYGYDYVPPEHYDVHMEYMAIAAAENGYPYDYCRVMMYASNGRTQDWQLHTHDIINIEPEVGTSSFWPSIGEILPSSEENLTCCMLQLWNTGGRVEFESLEVEDGYLNPGENESLILTVMNKGWGTSEECDLELTTSDPYVTLLNGTATTDTLVKRTAFSNSGDPFVLEVDASCPIGHEVDFTVNVAQGSYLRTKDVSLIVGQPDIFFSDGAETGMGNWTVSNGWGQCSINPYEGNYSFAESPTGSYTNNTTRIMTLSNPLDLSDMNQVWLEFYTRWDIESNYDFGQVEISTNGGASWTPLAGQYTVAGSGIGVQPSGQPGYEGTQASWVHEIMDLNDYIGETAVQFRFEFKSDGGVVGDGWFVDNIKVAGFTGPVTPLNVTVTLEPDTLPIIIPAGGGSFSFTISIQNNELFTAGFDAWIDVVLPNGSTYGPIILRTNMSLPSSGTIVRAMNQVIPPGAPSGTYEYRAFTGEYPNTVFSQDSFEFTKQN